MSLCNIQNMYVISHTGAIRGRIIVAVNLESAIRAAGSSKQTGQKAGLRPVVLTSLGSCPGGIEMP